MSTSFPKLGMLPQEGFVANLGLTMRFFPDNEPAHVRAVCEELFTLWRPLLERASEITAGFMIGNGEQILRWTGNLEDEFEWDHYLGHNNPQAAQYGFEPIPLRDFKPDWFHFTYADLRDIVRIFRETARDMYGLPLALGTLLEPGPEFCESLFRYVWHPEVITYMGGGHGNSIDYKGVLRADDRVYGAYPDGIPEGEPVARFMGRQVASFCQAMGFELLSISNGLGFGTYPWSIVGRNFDGTRFGLTPYRELADDILDFWVMFKSEMPGIRVSAQGSNWPVGIDLAAKGVPLGDLYDRRLLDFPLGYTVSVFFDDSVGFAMAAMMSRSAHAPGNALSFYLNDPWYPQDPWEDYPYDRHAFDLYAPASMALIGAAGEILATAGFGTLVHDSYGGTAPETARSFMPHLETALKYAPDAAGPVTWLYPFAECHDILERLPDQAGKVWAWDAFTSKAIDAGLPLNSVVSTEHLSAALASGVLGDTILYTPLPMPGADYVSDLLAWIGSGGKVLFYGPADMADSRIVDLLGIDLASPVAGEVRLAWDSEAVPLDTPIGSRSLLHSAVVCGGGLRERLSAGAAGVTVVGTASSQDEDRVYALSALEGQVAWVRGTLPFEIVEGERIWNHSGLDHVIASRLPRRMLSLMGYDLRHRLLQPDQRNPQMFIWRHRNAYLFCGYKPDNTVGFAFRLPDGAPIFTGDDALLEGGAALYHLEKSYHRECRVFVDQLSGIIRCRRTLNKEFTESEISIAGLQDATVSLYLPLDKIPGAYVRMQGPASRYGDGGFDIASHRSGDRIVLRGITGTLRVRW